MEVCEDDNKTVEYKTTPYRWVVILLLFGNVVTFSAISVSLSPAASNIAEAYQIDTLAVTFCAISFTLFYIPMTFAAIYMFDYMRPSHVFRIATFIALVGGWIRLFSKSSGTFTWVLIGWILISLAYPIVLTSLTLMCNTWLGDRERTLWIQILGLSVSVGSMVAFASSGYVFANSAKDYKADTMRLVEF